MAMVVDHTAIINARKNNTMIIIMTMKMKNTEVMMVDLRNVPQEGGHDDNTPDQDGFAQEEKEDDRGDNGTPGSRKELYCTTIHADARRLLGERLPAVRLFFFSD